MPCRKQESIEGRERGAGIAQALHAGLEDEGERAEGRSVGKAVIGRVGFGELLEAAGGGPVELAGVDNDAADGGAVAAEKLGGGIDHDIGSPLDGADKRRARRGVVDDQREPVLMGDGGQLRDVDNVELGIADGFGIDGAGLVIDGGAQAVKVVGIDEAHRDAETRQGVVEEIVGAAIERSRGDDFFTGRGEGE